MITESNNDIYLQESFTGDIDYFDHRFVDDKIRSSMMEKDKAKRSRKLQETLYDVIMNITNVSKRAINFKKLYKDHYKYDHILYKSVHPNLKYLNDDDKERLRDSIDSAFSNGTADSVASGVVGAILDVLIPKEIGILKGLVGKFAHSVIAGIGHGVFFDICPVKFKSIGEALVVYKKAAKESRFKSDETRKQAQYCYEVTTQIMEDLLKLYKEL
jgi:hypothetical protein